MKICVYCSAKDSIAEDYKLIGKALGEWIALRGDTLVFGGATGGLMTIVSESAIESGAHVIGVITKGITAAGRRSPFCHELIEVDNMNERKQTMKSLADCFICLPGSYGTLDEMFDVIASGTVSEHHKPCFILNHNGFYDMLQAQIKRMRQETFIPQNEIYKPLFVDTLEQLQVAVEQVNLTTRTDDLY